MSHLLFSFVKTEPDAVVKPIHEKAMPVLIRTRRSSSSRRRRRKL